MLSNTDYINRYLQNLRKFSLCKFKLSVIVRKKILKALATVSKSFTFPLSVKRDGICSVTWTFPVFLFNMFPVFISDFAMSAVMLLLL
jgi:hypothetical protein